MENQRERSLFGCARIRRTGARVLQVSAKVVERSFTAQLIAVVTTFYIFAAVGFCAGNEPPRSAAQSDELRALIEAYGRIKNAYVDAVDEKRLVAQAIKGMLSGLDPHSSYLDSEALGNWQADLEGEFGGLGIDMEMQDGAIKVIGAIDDTPASRAGLQAGDLITKLDNAEVKGMTLQQAMARMRGKPNTEITIAVSRTGVTDPLMITLKRAIIQVRSVKHKLLDESVGYIRVTRFQERTAEQLELAIEALYAESKQPLRGLVLDLRDNPGGLVSAAVGVSTAFLPANVPVVDLNGRTKEFSRHLSASGEHYLRGAKDDYMKRLPSAVKTVPMVVLVNASSASASEIVAGALQDYQRAIIMGTQTFGKGSVQTTLVLSNNTAIKLTTARYYTPNGRSIQAKGITPDMLVEDPNGNGRTREANLDRHLPNPAETVKLAQQDVKLQPVKADVTPTDVKSPAEPKAAAPKTEKSPRPEYGSKDDFQLNRALEFLRGQQTVSTNP